MNAVVDCDFCGLSGASKRVRDATGAAKLVHKGCWLTIQGMAGNLLCSDLLTDQGRRTARMPREE